jgi:hypothetical protein
MAITLNGTTGITTPDVDSTDLTATGNFTSRGIDDNATSTVMTLDTSGNLLVGKSSSGSSVRGSELRDGTSGFVATFKSDADGINIDRSTDGSLINLRKDGSTVGSIGAIGGDIYVGTGDTTLRFYDAGNAITPRGTNGAGNNGVIDLGGSSERFKNLYLSGGVYLGGTGSANKLDDYEEGTWTVSVNTGTLNNVFQATYTKIGNVVHCQFKVNTFSDFSSPVDVEFNLPFTPFTTDRACIGFNAITEYVSGIGDMNGYLNTGNILRIYGSITNGTYDSLKHTDLTSSSSMYVGFSYYTA